jgi:hypothetical protein
MTETAVELHRNDPDGTPEVFPAKPVTGEGVTCST